MKTNLQVFHRFKFYSCRAIFGMLLCVAFLASATALSNPKKKSPEPHVEPKPYMRYVPVNIDADQLTANVLTLLSESLPSYFEHRYAGRSLEESFEAIGLGDKSVGLGFASGISAPLINTLSRFTGEEMMKVHRRLFQGHAFCDQCIEPLRQIAILDWKRVNSYKSAFTAFNSLPHQHKRALGWLLQQKDRTVTIDSMFAKMIEITQGDTLAAFALGWDILSSGWDTHGGDREFFPRTLKLQEIPSLEGAIFPSWYHFWGMAMYGYLLGEHPPKFISRRMLARIVVAGEETWGVFPGMHRNPLKTRVRAHVDLAGFRFGRNLYLESIGELPDKIRYKESGEYLVEHPRFRAPLTCRKMLKNQSS